MRRALQVTAITAALLAAGAVVNTGAALARKSNVLVLSQNNYFGEGTIAAGTLRSLGYTVTLAQTMPASLSSYSAVWSLRPWGPRTSEEETALVAYVKGGGRLYLTGEREGFDVNESDQSIARSVLKNQEIVVGRQGEVEDGSSFNPDAEDEAALKPNGLGSFPAILPGGIAGIPNKNVLGSDSNGTAVGAVFDQTDMQDGKGRLVIYMDSNWLGSEWIGYEGMANDGMARTQVIENLEQFLEGAPPAPVKTSKGNMLVIERGDENHEGMMLASFLRSLNYTVAVAEDVPENITRYSSVWYVSSNTPLSPLEQAEFEQYLNQEGSLFLSGGSCCESLNASDTAIARAVLSNKEVYVGRQAPYNSANPDGTLTFNPKAADGISQSPNKLGEYRSAMPGGHGAIDGIEARNVLAGDDASAAAAVFDQSDMELGSGRLAIYENNDAWLGKLATIPQRMAAIQNIADFLERSPLRLAPRSAEYVALGDSYSAGVGAFSYLPGTVASKCYRATDGYAEKIAAATHLSFEFPACNGAKIHDLMEGKKAQLRTVGVDTNLVTLTIGGNDLGFSTVLASCIGGAIAEGGPGCAARDAAASATAYEWLVHGRPPGTYRLPGTSPSSRKNVLLKKWLSIKTAVTNKEPQPGLQELYEDIAMQAPYAHIIVIGYPRLFDKTESPTCSVGSLFFNTDQLSIATPDIEWIVEQTDKVDQLIEQAVANVRDKGVNISYVDLRAAFTGHVLCGPEPTYIFGVLGKETEPETESFHPTKAGQEVFYRLIEEARTGSE
jgi:lysophospholipase L1-like esterase